MKKIGLLSLALVLALGSLGVGYAAWTDTIYIDGSVSTGSVCWEIVYGSESQKNDDPDWNAFFDLNGGYIIKTGGNPVGVWPAGYPADYPRPDAKDVAHTTVEIENTLSPHVMTVTIDNGYPYYYDHIAYKVHYCGSIPGKIKEAVLKIDGIVVATFDANSDSFVYLDFDTPKATFVNPGVDDTEYELEFWWGNKHYFGDQIHFSEQLYHSFDFLIRQPAPQDSSLVFTIEYTIIQWNE